MRWTQNSRNTASRKHNGGGRLVAAYPHTQIRHSGRAPRSPPCCILLDTVAARSSISMMTSRSRPTPESSIVSMVGNFTQHAQQSRWSRCAQRAFDCAPIRPTVLARQRGAFDQRCTASLAHCLPDGRGSSASLAQNAQSVLALNVFLGHHNSRSFLFARSDSSGARRHSSGLICPDQNLVASAA